MGEDKLESRSSHHLDMQSMLHARLASEADGDQRITLYRRLHSICRKVNFHH